MSWPERPSRPGAGSTESRLRAIWEGVLGVAPLWSDDNFFDVGGGSLAAVRLFHAIHDHMGVDLPLSTLVRAQTPADMAAVIDSPAELRVPSAVLLRPGTASRPLFLVHSVSGDVLQLRPLALALETDRPVYGIQARGLDPAETPQTRVDEMAASYVHTVRSLQATGPYDLAGHSFGGLVAFEMARILARQGERRGLARVDRHRRCTRVPPWPARVRFAWPGRSASSVPCSAHPAGGCRATCLRPYSVWRPGHRWPRRRPSGRCRRCSTRLERISMEAFALTARAPFRGRHPVPRRGPRAGKMRPPAGVARGGRGRRSPWSRSLAGTWTRSSSPTWAPWRSGSVCTFKTGPAPRLITDRSPVDPRTYPTRAASARPAVRPENRQPPRNVPSSEL